MRWRWTVSFESDTLPVETARGELDCLDVEEAVRRGLRRAVAAHRKAKRYRSLVVVVEQLGAVDDKPLNETGPEFQPAEDDGHSERQTR